MDPRSRGRNGAPRYRVEFPPPSEDGLGQDEAFFYLVESDEREQIRFHQYGEIYRRPGLYEQLFYDRLKCRSPAKVSKILHDTLVENGDHPSALRVLDLGAGNGMVGAALEEHGVSRLVGVDIIPEAREAAVRDHPGLYDRYYVADLCALPEELRRDLEAWSFDCLLCVAALGFGDIPPRAFAEALNLVEEGGWVAFNIKETFLDRADTSGFSRMIRELIFSECLDLHHLERYQHRYAIDGRPLHYFAIVARKCGETLPEELVELAEE